MQRQNEELKNEIQLFKVGTNTVLKHMDCSIRRFPSCQSLGFEAIELGTVIAIMEVKILEILKIVEHKAPQLPVRILVEVMFKGIDHHMKVLFLHAQEY